MVKEDLEASMKANNTKEFKYTTPSKSTKINTKWTKSQKYQEYINTATEI